jgi:heparan-sulfate lyase
VFFVDKSFFIFVDEAIGSATGNVALHFQLAPGNAIIDTANMKAQTVFPSGWNLMVQNVISDGARMIEETGQVSFVYVQRMSRPAFRYQVRKIGARGLRFVTVIAPYNGLVPPDINVELPVITQVGSNTFNLRVTANNRTRQIGYSF